MTTIDKKKKFVISALNTNDFKSKHARHFLSSIYEDSELLERVHFVHFSDVKKTDLGIVFAAEGTKLAAIKIQMDGIYTSDEALLGSLIHLFQTGYDIYVGLAIPGIRQWDSFKAVRVLLDELGNRKYSPFPLTYTSPEVRELLEPLEALNEKRYWQAKIDEALDTGNIEQFKEYSAKLYGERLCQS